MDPEPAPNSYSASTSTEEESLTVIDTPEFTWEEIEWARQNHKLLTFGMELSNLCNFRCMYCYRNAGEPLPDELTLQELVDAAQQALELGIRKVGIVGAGEPTLDNRLLPLLNVLTPVKVNLFTNGTGITPELAEDLTDFRTNIILKVNSLNPDVHDVLVGRKGGYNLMMKGLHNLLDAGCDPSKITIESVITKQNIDDLPTLWKWSRDNRFIPFVERVTPQGRALHADVAVPPLQLLQFFQKIKKIDEYYGYTWSVHPPCVSSSCLRHYHYCLLDACGNVLPCSGVTIAVGNIRKQSLADIIRTSPVIRDLRFIDQNIKGYCAECKFIPLCYGCRGAAYQMTGDYLAADPLCWNPLLENGEDH